ARVRVRPGPWTWSALEYTCHLRDVFTVNVERVRLVLTEERPTLVSMNRDERAIREGYNDQDPARVIDELGAAAEELAGTLDGVGKDQWDRVAVHHATGELSLRWMAANVVHEARHHLMDVRRVLAAVSE